jgi:hypothetical protein
LSPEDQARVRRLDRDLQEEDSPVQARLWKVLERYAAWLDRQSTEHRRAIQAAPDGDARLKIVRRLREQEWVDRQPAAVQHQLRELPGEQRSARVKEMRQDERRRRDEWQVAIRHWSQLLSKQPPPSTLDDFPPPVRWYVTECLLPALGPEEKARLKKAEGQWPHYPRTLVELADRHPLLLPGPSMGPRRFEELPEEVRRALPELQLTPPQAVAKAEGRWPAYAAAVTGYARRKNVRLPRQLGPCRPEEFAAPVRQFLAEQLTLQLTPEEKKQLGEAEGEWPRYPRMVLELARRHQLRVPGMGLPGARQDWDKYRPRNRAQSEPGPAVPERWLREFALTELTKEDRARLNLSISDPESRERLRQEWIRRHPKEWQRLLQVENRKRQRQAPPGGDF